MESVVYTSLESRCGKGLNDLQTVNPELAQQWHTAKNRNLKPTQVTSNSHRKVWWILSYDIPGDYPIEHLRGKHFDFEWESTIAHRNNGRDCPYLNGKAVWPGFNDIATINPELAAQWHPVKNGNLKTNKSHDRLKKRKCGGYYLMMFQMIIRLNT